MSSSPIYLDEWKLRELFNREVLPRIEAEELQELVLSEGPAHPKYGQEPGAQSQMVAYYEAGKGSRGIIGPKVAVIHRYRLPDGSLGGSGLPDPKSVKLAGKFYVLKSAPSSGGVKKAKGRGKR